MATALTEPSRGGFLGPDPGLSIRVWVALLLRMGIGLTLLGTGLAGYFGLQSGRGAAGFLGQGSSLAMLDPFISGLPYVAIALGLALILGFLTTASAIGAGFFGLVVPVFAIIQIMGAGSLGGFPMGGGGRWGNDQFFSMMLTMSLPNLLTNAAMIWLSPLENHPYSVDALIFGRNEIDPFSPVTTARPEVPTPPAAEVILQIEE